MKDYLRMQIEEKKNKKEEIERSKIIDRKNIIVKEESNMNNILVEKNMKKINTLDYKKMLDEQVSKKKPYDFMTREELRINNNLINQNVNVNKSMI